MVVQDHKTHKRIPSWDYRLTNLQAPLYLWLLKEAYDLDVNTFEWDYICTADYPTLRLTKSGRLAKQSWAKLDYIEARRQLDNLGVDTYPPELEKLRQLRGLPSERYCRVPFTYSADRLSAWIERARTTVQTMLDYPDDPGGGRLHFCDSDRHVVKRVWPGGFGWHSCPGARILRYPMVLLERYH